MSRGKRAGAHFSHLQAGAANANLTQFTGTLGWTRKLHFFEEDDYSLDLSCLQPFGRLGAVIFDGALIYSTDKRRQTVMAMKASLVTFTKYLEWLIDRREIQARPKPKHLTPALFAGFASWLTNRAQSGLSYSTGTAAIQYGYAASTVRLSIEKYRTEFSQEFSVVSNPLAHSQHIESLAGRAQPLQTYDYKMVQDAAIKDALAIINDPARPTAPQYRAQLIPFYLLLLLRTCTNPSSAMSLRRDCLERHPFEIGTWLIHFEKPRSGTGHTEDYSWFDYDDGDLLSPLNIVRFLLTWTAPLVALDSKNLNRLFLYTTMRANGNARVNSLDRGKDTVAVRDDSRLISFAARHKLRPFTAKLLRESAASNTWLRTKSTWQVKTLLNHKHFITTGRYLLGKNILEAANVEISEGENAMTKAYIKGYPIIREKPLRGVIVDELRIQDPAASKIIEGYWHTGLGGCTNPMDSPMPNQTKGKLCTAFWACIYCSRAVFALEHLPLLIARQVSVRAAAQTIHDSTWSTRYGKIDAQLTEVISGFSNEAQNIARVAVSDAQLSSANVDVITLLKSPIVY